MIGALRYFATRLLARRYWPKAGATSTFVPDVDRTFVVPSESRTFTVPAETRTFVVPGD